MIDITASYPLSEREAEVLRLLTTKSVREIADELCLSVGTVKSHLSQVISKIGVESQTAAIAYAFANGYASAPRRSQIWRRGYVMVNERGEIQAAMVRPE